jgi:hypothetical protein
MLQIQTPDHAGSRDQAADLARDLPRDLTSQSVQLDCSRLVVVTPSFCDEVVKQILVERNAATLDVHDASERARELLEQSAQNRGVRDRVRVAVRTG